MTHDALSSLIQWQIAQVDEDEIKGTALEILFDLITLFGLDTFGCAAEYHPLRAGSLCSTFADSSADAETTASQQSLVHVLQRYLDRQGHPPLTLWPCDPTLCLSLSMCRRKS